MLAGVRPLGGQEGSENPSKEGKRLYGEGGCVEEGRRESWKLGKEKKSGMRATEGNVLLRGKCGFS